MFSAQKTRLPVRSRQNQIPHLTPDTIGESDKNLRKHHTQESREVGPFPADDHKAARNRHDTIVDKSEK